MTNNAGKSPPPTMPKELPDKKPIKPTSKIALPKRVQGLRKPVLQFSPTAWAKLLYFRDRGQTEISGFGITPEDDLLYVQEFITIPQATTVVSISLDDTAVADFFDMQVDQRRSPVQFGRIWIHSHPGDSPTPSHTDEETFERVFGNCQHALMVIVASGGKSYARLRFNVGPGGDVVIPVEVDFEQPFEGSDFAAWEAEYKANVRAGFSKLELGLENLPALHERDIFGQGLCMDDVTLSELADMDDYERQSVLAELGF